jgi:hypothetical protein
MKVKIIKIVKAFSKRPYGRYEKIHGEASGESFRKNLLVPELRKAIEDGTILEVNLDGYNRYGRSFLDEAFGGLVREEGFSYEQVIQHIKVRHSTVKSFELLVEERLKAAKAAKE